MHGIVPGGGLSHDGERWAACKPGFFLSVRVLSRLFRRRFLEELDRAHHAGLLRFFGDTAQLTDARTFTDWLAPLRNCEWVVYAKRPFAGPQALLAMRRFLSHVLPSGFQRIRHFGLFANAERKSNFEADFRR